MSFLSTAYKIKQVLFGNCVILLYHRVIDLDFDYYNIAISPAVFEEHLRAIKSNFHVLSIKEFERCYKRGKFPRNSALITFDDGYADFLWNAKPLLEEYQVPATLFVVSNYLNSKKEFWWDYLPYVFLQTKLLPSFLIFKDDQGAEQVIDFAGEESLPDNFDHVTKALPKRAKALQFFSNQFRRSNENRRNELREMISKWSGVADIVREQNRVLTIDEVLDLQSSPLISIGAHTLNHPVLASLSADEQRDEIGKSKRNIERILGEEAAYIAYPHGAYNIDYTDETVKLSRDVGFKLGFSVVNTKKRTANYRFEIPRYTVEPLPADELIQKISNKEYYV